MLITSEQAFSQKINEYKKWKPSRKHDSSDPKVICLNDLTKKKKSLAVEIIKVHKQNISNLRNSLVEFKAGTKKLLSMQGDQSMQSNSDYFKLGKAKEQAGKAKLTLSQVSETDCSTGIVKNQQSEMSKSKLRFLDKLSEISTRNDREACILKGIFSKNFADGSVIAKTKSKINENSKEETFSNYYKSLQKQQSYHKDWILNNKKLRLKWHTIRRRLEDTSPMINNAGQFTPLENSTSAEKKLFTSILKDKVQAKSKEYKSKILGSIFPDNR